MKRLLSLLCMCCIGMVVFADPVSLQQAEKLAIAFFSPGYSSLRSASEPVKLVWTGSDPMELRSATEEAPFYVFNYTQGSGFVVVSGDDSAYPVLAYDLNQPFTIANMPSNIRSWFKSYGDQIDWLRENKIPPTDEIAEAWTKAAEGTLLSNTVSSVSLSTALWDQLTPYNSLCPTISGTKAPTGCVATSTAIAMKYYQWPARGQGSFSYTSSTYGLSLSANFATTFDWLNMPDQYVSGQYTTQQGQNVATLMYDCGVFSQMDYGPQESGALTLNAAIGLVNYMMYDVGLQVLSGVNYAASEWLTLLENELNNNRPVVFGGANSQNEGHQFVLDGYNTSGYFHVNWGWSGLANGYYLITSLDPTDHGTGVVNGGGFSLGQQAMIGLQTPQTGSTYNDVLTFYADVLNGTSYSGLKSSTSNYVANQPFTVTAGIVVNSSLRNFNGVATLALVDYNGNVKQYISQNKSLSIPMGYGVAFSLPCTITTTIAPTDRIRLMYKSTDVSAYKWTRGDASAAGELYINPSASAESHPVSLANIVLHSDQLHIDSPDEIKEVAIYSVNGALMYKENIQTFSRTLNCDKYPSGIYLVQVITGKGKITQKIAK